jgi:23S rRNA pseudouridine1911/1915/1917 synthase
LRALLAFEIANGGQVSIVNRLDRETSGIVLAAKNARAARKFGLLMQSRRVLKEYTAIVWGWPEWNKKRVVAPMIRQGEIAHSSIYLKQCIDESGVEAVTELEVSRRFRKKTSRGASLSGGIARPLTGRTHQIRVHLASLGHAIVGDKIYGPDENLYLRFIETGWTGKLAQELLLERHSLHASRLRIDARDWTSPLPADFLSWLPEMAFVAAVPDPDSPSRALGLLQSVSWAAETLQYRHRTFLCAGDSGSYHGGRYRL